MELHLFFCREKKIIVRGPWQSYAKTTCKLCNGINVKIRDACNIEEQVNKDKYIKNKKLK